jgi:hypothetical protein
MVAGDLCKVVLSLLYEPAVFGIEGIEGIERASRGTA